MDSVLNEIRKLNNRIDTVEAKFDAFETKLSELDDKYEDKCAKLAGMLVTKASAEVQNLLQCKVDQLEQQLKSMQIAAILQECYNKRLNILIHGIDKTVWESEDQTMALFHNFLSNSLKLDPEKILIVDIPATPKTTTENEAR